MKRRKEKKEKKNDLGIAFKVSKYIESSSEDDDDEETDLDDVEYLTNRLCKFLYEERGAKEANKKKSKLICYECNE